MDDIRVASRTTLPPGTRLGRYEIERVLGRGGAGSVYLARATGVEGLEIRFALKVLHPAPGARAALLAEAQALQGARHSNVVQVVELGRERDLDFVAFEYVEGPSLAEVLRRERARAKTLPAALAFYVGAEICKALAFVHGRRDDEGRALGLVHRDVTPSNILLSRAGEVKLADFGVARAAHRAAGDTDPGAVKGKLGYLAPEQAAGQPLDGRCDLFALGVCVYEALTGVNPFVGTDDIETWRRTLAAATPPPLRGVTEASGDEAIDEFFARALAKEPAQRFATANEMRGALALLAPLRLEPSPDLTLGRYLEVAESAPAVVRPLAKAAALALGDGAPEEGTTSTPSTRPSVKPAPQRQRRLVGVGLSLAGVLAAVMVAGLSKEDAPGSAASPRLTSKPAAVAGTSDPPTRVAPHSEGPSQGAVVPPQTPGPGKLPARLGKGTLRVNLDPWAEVILNGRSLGNVPRTAEVAAGRHMLTLRNPDLRLERSLDLVVAAGQTLTITEWPK